MKWICIGLLKVYKAVLSPMLGKSCIYTPTCSVYGMEAFREFGTLKGGILTLKRVLRCAPWGKGGFDPIPYHFKGDLKWML